MSDFPTNVHAEFVERCTDEADSFDGRLAAAGFTALAYELRTANLIAALSARWANGSAMFPAEADTLRSDILARLGYGVEAGERR
ncbi:MAG: hypothetical protein ACTHJM_12125 [Marmoricola sp.]